MHTKEIIRTYLSANITKNLEGISTQDFEKLTELRIRTDKPLIFYRMGAEEVLSYRPSMSDIAETVERISQYSMYAFEEELRMGFITLPGGHRVGLTGKVTAEGGRITALRPISGLNIRICRAVKGCANQILPRIMENGLPHNTMLISPPGCGKTTMLRDIIRQLSDGSASSRAGITVGVVDERSEIGGSYRGVAQLDVGIRTDLLDACPKAEGMMLLLRALSPKVIAVDELGGIGDIKAVEEVSNAGVRLICTVHGRDVADARQKPALAKLLSMGIFTRFVVMKKIGAEAEVFA